MTAKRILVTGANKGIGLATVEMVLSAAPDTHALLGTRDRSRGDTARDQLVAKEPTWADRITVVQVDVGDDASVAAAAETVKSLFSGEATPLYGIVNNAGIGFGPGSIGSVLKVNTYGPKRVVEAFLPLLEPAGRIVNVASASGPNFVAACSPQRQAQFISPDTTWNDIQGLIDECLAVEAGDGDFEAAGFGDGQAYGLSKACLNAYTIELAREHPELAVNACTPGFIETDMTRPFAEMRGVTPADMGMKAPDAGTKAAKHLLFDDVGGSGWYFGSDAVRSPLDRYRSPGDPPYEGD